MKLIMFKPIRNDKERKKLVQLKSIHEFIKKGTLTPFTTQPTMKIINQNDTPQHCIPTDSNDISTASCPLQIDERNVTFWAVVILATLFRII